MRYTLEFKLRCIELYKQGFWPEKQFGFKNAEDFQKEIRKWKRLYDFSGIDAIRPKTKKKQWLAKERYELVINVIAGKSDGYGYGYGDCPKIAYAIYYLLWKDNC